jgi:hypothetical protein
MREMIHSVIGFMMLATATNVMGCAKTNCVSTKEINDLKSHLSQLKGEFIWREDLGKYHYSNKLQIEKILSTQNTEETIVFLVDSLDDKSKTQSKIDNETVPLGIICYEALKQLVYYEPATPDGDIEQNWPGYISPKSTPEEIKAAKKAWNKIVKTKSYIIQ